MSTGLGIFLAALAGIAAWQIDRHKAWKGAGKVILAVVTAPIAALALYNLWESREKASQTRQLNEVAPTYQDAGLRQYWGVTLGMSQSEVRYLKGEPEGPGSSVSPAVWIYPTGTGRKYMVIWTPERTVATVVCNGVNYSPCEAVAGITNGNSEAELVNRFGAGSVTVADAQGAKMHRYGPPEASLFFILKESAINAVGIRAKSATAVGSSLPPSSFPQGRLD
jgi:hypothetical protein